MATFFEALGNAAKSFACGVLSVAENYAEIGKGSILFGNDGAEAAFLGGVRRQLCDQNPPNVPEQQVPNGQCPGVEYNIVWSYERLSGAFPGTWVKTEGFFTGCNGEICGPISGPKRRRNAPNTGYEYYWTYKRCYNNTTGEQKIGFTDINRYRNFTYRYERCTGSIQNCDRPTPPAVGWDRSAPTDVTYTVGGNNYTIQADFNFGGLKFDVNGELNVVVGVNYIDPDLNVPVDIDLNVPIDLGGFNFDFGGNSDEQDGGDDGCPQPKPDDAEPETEPPASEDPDQTGEDEPPPTPAQVIRAAVVTVRSIDPEGDVGQLQQDDNPDILVPNAGYISFKILIGNTVSWTSDIPVKNIRNFIPCPWDRGAIEVTGTPRNGVQWTITPIFSKLDETT